MNNSFFKANITLFFLVFCLNAHAQIDDLLKNKDITWAIEIYNDFVPEGSQFKPDNRYKNDIKLLKFTDNGQGYYYDDMLFKTLLQDNIRNDKIAMYADSLCKNKIQSSKIVNGRVDTVITIDPFTFAKSMIVAKSSFNTIEYDFLRAYQILYYNAKKAQFGLQTVSIAIMIPYYDEEGKSLHKPWYWLKPNDLSKKININKKQFTSVHEMVQPKGFFIKGNDVKVLKLSQPNMPIEHLLSTIRTNPKVPFYGSAQRDLLSYTFAKRKEIVTPSMDTLRVIDPITQFPIPDTLKIAPNFLDTDFKGLRLVQNWYWNDKKKRLEIFMVAVAPMLETDINSDDFLIRRALIYRRNF